MSENGKTKKQQQKPHPKPNNNQAITTKTSLKAH